MPKTEKYTEEQNQLLIDELKINWCHIKKESMEMMEELWPGFYKGQTRKAYSLFLQTINLAKKTGIQFNVESTPKRNRNRKKYPPQKVPKKTRLFDQIQVIVQTEIKAAIIRATGKINRLVEEILIENKELKEECKNLRPYKNVVEREYSKELDMRGGN